MQVRFKNPRQHGRIVCDDFPRLRFVGDIENAQATLIVQKSTAHEELLGRKNLVHILAMFSIKGLLTNRFPLKPGWARGVDDDEHQ